MANEQHKKKKIPSNIDLLNKKHPCREPRNFKDFSDIFENTHIFLERILKMANNTLSSGNYEYGF